VTSTVPWYNRPFPIDPSTISIVGVPSDPTRSTRSSTEVPETQSKPVGDVAGELWELTKAYAKQETVDPLKGVGRYLAFGVAGSLTLGIGVILLLLAALRALQTETGTALQGNWSWVPYLVVLVVGAGLIGLAVSRIGAASNDSKS
jgi:hypothetical protein